MKIPKNNDKSDAATVVIPYELCPAKTFETSRGISVGRSVESHCTIVGNVARELIARYTERLGRQLFPAGAELVASAHDIGKVSPTFYEKIRRNCQLNLIDLPALKDINPTIERTWGGHAGVSQLTVKALGAPKYIPEILGQHHGFSPQLSGSRATGEKFGGEGWQEERERLLAALKLSLGVDWPEIDSMPRARLLAGLTSVADWIGSGRFFENPDVPWQENIKRAVDDAGFITPSYRQGLRFEDVFGFTPRPAQTAFIEQVSQPGVYVLEAPTGMGKTEAALYAAYQLLEAGKASGVYFALPTQLTSNKIFERFNDFLTNILADDCQHRSLLLHANAWQITEMGEEGRPGGAWFNHAKRGLLAPFAVGTLDQALMAAMNVKHGFVRAFGLAGKVVILDEVHTYDAYTGTLLDALISLLRQLQCSVIVLSATLNHERRQELLKSNVRSNAYPLISACCNNNAVTEVPVDAPPSFAFSVQMEADDSVAVEEALCRAEAGQQVLWIENTVRDAQQRYLDLAARAADIGIATGLLHSRFTRHDRQLIEGEWVNRFGKPGWSARNQQGRILVGTQVLEQSLDIDADFLVSRFAPSDFLVQRFGRLWRHADTPRAVGARREAWLLAPSLDAAIESPIVAFGASAFVYSTYVLCRSLEVWQSRRCVTLPQDVRTLIEATYCARDETDNLRRMRDELENGTSRRKGKVALAQLARVSLSQGGKTLPETKAQTRYSEVESRDVLLLRHIEQLPEDNATKITLLDGQTLLLPHNRCDGLGKKEWRQLSARLMTQQVTVRVEEAPATVALDMLKRYRLQHCFYLGDPAQDEAQLRVALIDDIGRVKSLDGKTVHEKYPLEYRDDLGYRVIRNEEP